MTCRPCSASGPASRAVRRAGVPYFFAEEKEPNVDPRGLERRRPFGEGPAVRIRLDPAESPSLLPELLSRVENAGFPRGCARLASAETRRLGQDRANRRQYLCRAIFQYRSAADGVGEKATPIPIKSGRSPSLIVRWISSLGPGSTKAQHDPLIVPGKRQA